VSFAQGSGFTGQTIGGTFKADTDNFIPWKSSGVFDAFDPTKQGNAGVANFTGGDGSNRPFFATTLAQVTQGTWTYNNNGTTQSYGFGSLFDRLQPLVARLGADVVHVQPGVDLVNSNGAITVQTNWNLAAGTAGNLQTAGSTTYFDPARSYVDFTYRLST